jgi:hypothetical protein
MRTKINVQTAIIAIDAATARNGASTTRKKKYPPAISGGPSIAIVSNIRKLS